MSRSFLAAAAVLVTLTARPALGQDLGSDFDAASAAAINALQPVSRAVGDEAMQGRLSSSKIAFERGPRRSFMMPTLYASAAMMQVLDVHSTFAGMRQGGTEGNPVLAGVASNKLAFVAAKASIAVGTIFATREVAKRNKLAAAITLIGVNSLYAIVASHNYKIAHGGR